MNKIPVRIVWIPNADDGKLESEINIKADDLLNYQGSIVKEIKKFKRDYAAVVTAVNARVLKEHTKNKEIKKFWSCCSKLVRFNDESKFLITNLTEFYQKDLKLSIKYVRDCLGFVEFFQRKDLVNGIPLGYYNVIIERGATLKKYKKLKLVKKKLIDFANTGKLPPRDAFREELNEMLGN